MSKITSQKIPDRSVRFVLVKLAAKNHWVICNPTAAADPQIYPVLEIENSTVTWSRDGIADGISIEETIARLSYPPAEKITGTFHLGNLVGLTHESGGVSWAGGSATAEQINDFLAEYKFLCPGKLRITTD